MVEYGMTPLQAIRAATSVAAENIGWGDRVGSIEKGKYADLVAVAGDPARPYVLSCLRRLTLDAIARVTRMGRAEPQARRASRGRL
jgi:imidazolonepropionase-like amidohydrolase